MGVGCFDELKQINVTFLYAIYTTTFKVYSLLYDEHMYTSSLHVWLWCTGLNMLQYLITLKGMNFCRNNTNKFGLCIWSPTYRHRLKLSMHFMNALLSLASLVEILRWNFVERQIYLVIVQGPFVVNNGDKELIDELIKLISEIGWAALFINELELLFWLFSITIPYWTAIDWCTQLCVRESEREGIFVYMTNKSTPLCSPWVFTWIIQSGNKVLLTSFHWSPGGAPWLAKVVKLHRWLN